uniref:NACHT LRR and PYD domain-containing protein n=1 Tax=Astyanax mexicanus TaxID=7994 RepID=A0A3B1IHH4_ASTMX
MCHIPVFCWISATVLQQILEETETEETPKTLTNMYTCFLIFQAVQGNLKYTGRNDLDIPLDKEAILGLGKLAFQHLEKNSLIFNAEDLESCGIDRSTISVYSGLCTQETVRFRGTVFSFVHLSIQEFIAAVFSYICVRNEHRNVFEPQSTSQKGKTTELIDFLKTAVDKALESEHGNLDLFLRFLLGLLLESNEVLIRGLLTQTGSSTDCRKEIVEYIKLKFKENPSPERSINLFYCLNELNDDSLVKEIQSYMSSGRLSEAELSPAQWSALVFVLLTSKEKLDEFDLKKFIRSDECLNRLLPVVQEATSALLSECKLTERSCSALLKVLGSESSTLTLLDLSNNPIQDCGVELLSEGLKSSNCKLEKLILKSQHCTCIFLSFCSITGRGYGALSSALNPSSPLKELDLSGNDPGDTGLCELLEEGYVALASVLKSNSTSTLTELDLRGNDPGDTGVQLTNVFLLLHSNCRLNNGKITEKGCEALSAALRSNPSHLIELDLSKNDLGNSGVNSLCKVYVKFISLPFLFVCRLSNSDVTEEGCAALSAALCSNPSHLIELDLSGNKLGNSGLKQLFNIVNKQHSKLQNPAAEKAFHFLVKALETNPLLLTELNLSERNFKDLEMNFSHLTLFRLKSCGITEEGCSDLSAALCSNPSHLIELDLSGNKMGNHGVKQFCGLLENDQFKLSKLQYVTL